MSRETRIVGEHNNLTSNEPQRDFKWLEADIDTHPHQEESSHSERKPELVAALHSVMDLLSGGQASALTQKHDISNVDKNPLGSCSWKSASVSTSDPGSKAIWNTKENIPARFNSDMGFSVLPERSTHVLSHIKEEPCACDPPQDIRSYLPTPDVNKLCMYSEHAQFPSYKSTETSVSVSACDQISIAGMQNIATEVRPHPCVLCGAGFDTWEAVNVHLQIHGVLTQTEQQLSEHELNAHMVSHDTDKPYKCSVCQYTCSTSSRLRQHMRTHTGEKPHTCSQCGKQFTMASSVKRHMMTHTGEKPHACSVCHKQFSYTSNLKTHMMTHTGEKPRTCSVCRTDFRSSSCLRRHMKVHSRETPQNSSVYSILPDFQAF